MKYQPKRSLDGTVALALVVVGLLLSPAARAQQKQARVWGTVADENGAPVPDVAVTAEVPETGNVVARAMTDAEGKYSLVLNDATVKYLYRLSKDGYLPLAEQLEVAVKANAEYNMTLPSTASVRGGAQADGSYAMHPDAVEPFNKGLDAARSGDFATAIEALQQVLEVDDKVVPALVALSAIHLEQKNYDQALAMSGRALELEPANSKGIELQYFAAKGGQASIGDLMPMLAQLEGVQPKKAAVEYAAVGVTHFNTGETAKAEEAFTHALELDPELASAHFQLGLCYVTSKPELARQHFERVVELEPDSEDAKQATEMISYLK